MPRAEAYGDGSVGPTRGYHKPDWSVEAAPQCSVLVMVSSCAKASPRQKITPNARTVNPRTGRTRLIVLLRALPVGAVWRDRTEEASIKEQTALRCVLTSVGKLRHGDILFSSFTGST